MVACRYVGGDFSMLGDREFDEVGQRAVLSEQGFREAVLGGAAFITEEDFARVGFMEEELTRYGKNGERMDPPNEFCIKLLVAQQVYRDICQRMRLNPAETVAELAEA